METPPNLLRLARMEAGLTQEELAEKLEMSSMTIYRWESGQRMPTFLQRLRICACLGKSEQELWPQEDEEPFAPDATTLFDPSIPLGSALVGQHTLVNALLHSYLATPAGRQTIGLIGLPGEGKTAVAASLIATPAFQRHFAGVLWASVGQHSSPRWHLQRWASLLGETLSDDVEQGREQIRMAIGWRPLLIVLDDVWRAEDVRAYQCGGPRCSYLLTTRHPSLARTICDVVYRPVPLTMAQAVQMLSRGLPARYAHQYQSALEVVATHMGKIPQALERAVGSLRAASGSGSARRMEEAIRRLASPACSLHNRGAEQESLFAAIARSEQWLVAPARKALRCLATSFPAAPSTFAERQALDLLQGQGLGVRELDLLLDAGLLDAVGESCYQLHPIIAAYAHLRAAPQGSHEAAPPVIGKDEP